MSASHISTFLRCTPQDKPGIYLPHMMEKNTPQLQDAGREYLLYDKQDMTSSLTTLVQIATFFQTIWRIKT
jgi:hypothetical protein